MQLVQLFSQHISDIFATLALFSIVIEVAPIKINPWSFLAKKIGKAMNSDVLDSIDTLYKKVNQLDGYVKQLEQAQLECEAKRARTRILRFGDEVRLNVKHAKDSFDEVLADITFYDTYCSTHPDFKNNRTKSTEKVIVDVYEECLRNDSFL